MTDIFGNIVSGDQIEMASLATLELWWPVYSRELELQVGLAQDALPLPRSYITADRVDRENADQLPSVVVISPGFQPGAPPRMDGDGVYRATWALGVGLFASGAERQDTRNLIRWYAAIARMIMLQKCTLGGIAQGIAWLDESYDDNFTWTDQKTIGAGEVAFAIEVGDVANRSGGPIAPPNPDTQPGSSWPNANTVSAVVEMKE